MSGDDSLQETLDRAYSLSIKNAFILTDMAEIEQHQWWQSGVIYQIYPRSFMDSDGDGVGDLEGILQRLDYLDWLGVDALWLSPIFPSPMADFGYDIKDYRAIDSLFGSMQDFDRLLEAVHDREMKLILDLVPNHTSDEHPWFEESRSSRDNARRDWYIWEDSAPDGGPPNNWLSVFGGSAWEYDEKTGQYYYHAFLKEQPDLNWRNPEVQEAMLDVMRFWLDKGIDGFRIDVLWHLIKDDQLRDNPPNPDYQPGQPEHQQLVRAYTVDQPEVHDIAATMRELVGAYDERVLIGEIYLPIDRLVAYYGEKGKGIHLPFNFQLILMPWEASTIREVIVEYEGALPLDAWPNWVLSNHDNPRVASRTGPAQARVAAMLLLTLRGTPTMYYGDELGMQDVEVPPERIRDPHAINEPEADVGRDPERTPMQWSAKEHAGFSSGTPWLPVAEDYQRVNVEVQQDDPSSMLSLSRRIIALRKDEPALAVGSYAPVDVEGNVLAYIREHGTRRLLVALNMGAQSYQLTPAEFEAGRVLLSTHLDREGEEVAQPLMLRPDEGAIVEMH